MLGDAALDVVVRPSATVAPGGDVPASIRRTVGGAGANTAAWLAALGMPTTLLARIGDDAEGRRITDELTERGVRCRFAIDPTAPTCGVVVVVDKTGQRTMFSDRGAAALLSDNDIDADLIAAAGHLHVSGYVLLDASSRPAARAALAIAREAGVRTSVDPQTAVTLGPLLLDLVRDVGLLLPNATELATLTGSPDPASAKALLDVVGAVVITDGDAGATWVDRTGMRTVPAARVPCVDSTGAGDAFNAGLIAALLSGATDPLTNAVATAADAVTRPGAAPPLSRR